MEILVTYDVSTETASGRRRLRRVAHLCEAYGQRVQKSVFECVLNEGQYEQLKHRLLHEIDPQADSLRFYRSSSHASATYKPWGDSQSSTSGIHSSSERRADPKRWPRAQEVRAARSIQRAVPVS
jgi:CRISPR-associated protein Cas2